MRDFRLTKALRVASRALREVAEMLPEEAECEHHHCHHEEEECCDEEHEPHERCCERPGCTRPEHPACPPEPRYEECHPAPAPPYPPMPPYPSMPPYPPFPPYPPYVIISGSGCGCGCHGQAASPPVMVPPSPPVPVPPPPSSPPPSSPPPPGPPTISSVSSLIRPPAAGAFPDPSALAFDALLDLGETAAEMVRSSVPRDLNPQETSQ
jgi:hypothetical protein